MDVETIIDIQGGDPVRIHNLLTLLISAMKNYL